MQSHGSQGWLAGPAAGEKELPRVLGTVRERTRSRVHLGAAGDGTGYSIGVTRTHLCRRLPPPSLLSECLPDEGEQECLAHVCLLSHTLSKAHLLPWAWMLGRAE